MRRTTPVEPSEPVEPAEPLLHVITGRHAPRPKFESRDEWPGIRDWGLGVTGILRHRHPERSGGIFTALRESACMCRGKTMSWCCLTCDDERSAIKTLGYARNDDAREALSKLRGASDFYAPHHHSSLLTPNWRVELSHAIKGRHAPEANPEPLSPHYTLLHKKQATFS